MSENTPDPRGLCQADRAVLLCIDVQGKLAEMVHESDRLRVHVSKMMRLAGLFEVPVVLTEQYPKGLGPTVPELLEIYDGLSVEKHRVEKNAFGCCGEPGFDDLLRRVARERSVIGRSAPARGGAAPLPPARSEIVVVGMETHVCVQQTVLELLRQGFRVVVVADAVSGRVPEYHELALTRFRQCGAVITCYESVAFEWARTKEHACFKQMSAIVKE
jgi:nicotinamidase-related amidase